MDEKKIKERKNDRKKIGGLLTIQIQKEEKTRQIEEARNKERNVKTYLKRDPPVMYSVTIANWLGSSRQAPKSLMT